MYSKRKGKPNINHKFSIAMLVYQTVNTTSADTSPTSPSHPGRAAATLLISAVAGRGHRAGARPRGSGDRNPRAPEGTGPQGKQHNPLTIYTLKLFCLHSNVYLPIFRSIHLVRLSIYPSMHLSIHPSIHPSMHPSIYQLIYDLSMIYL